MPVQKTDRDNPDWIMRIAAAAFLSGRNISREMFLGPEGEVVASEVLKLKCLPPGWGREAAKEILCDERRV